MEVIRYIEYECFLVRHNKLYKNGTLYAARIMQITWTCIIIVRCIDCKLNTHLLQVELLNKKVQKTKNDLCHKRRRLLQK